MLASLSTGAEVLRELQREMSLERAEGIMDRVGEGVAAQKVRSSLHLSETTDVLRTPELTRRRCVIGNRRGARFQAFAGRRGIHRARARGATGSCDACRVCRRKLPRYRFHT